MFLEQYLEMNDSNQRQATEQEKIFVPHVLARGLYTIYKELQVNK